MAERLTPQQQIAVDNRGGKLLVSAAAGSGKTKVLVDRLIKYLLDPVSPANIDDFLIITYTKAAASELRAKIASKLSEQIALNPGNRHLQRQLQRLYLAKISTVHSFCGDILREYAYMMDISADFRVADESECQEIQIQIIDQLLEESYANEAADSPFYTFVDTQGFGRNDNQIPEIILKVYSSARCHPDPDGWLNWCLNALVSKPDTKPEDTIWGAYIISDLQNYLASQISALNSCYQKALRADSMEKPAALFQSTIFQIELLKACNSWEEIRKNRKIDYGRLTFSKKCTDLLLIDEMKAVRTACKEGIAKKLSAFSDSAEQVVSDLQASYAAACGLIDLVRKFNSMYTQRKRQRRVMDFGDLEHKMLDLLLGKKRSGSTGVAAQIGERFREVMIDEYQDSNEVQDKIFATITEKRQNCFMVGDVKQSIYQFRLADPDIFLEKYHSYAWAEEATDGAGRKVVLSSNFRSSSGIISAVNDVFCNCMSKQVGGVSYGKSEYLVEGTPHIPLNEPEVELHGICVKENTYAEEAAFTADRIAELLSGSHMVRSGDSLRQIQPEDIVILLRSPGSVGYSFKQALEARGISCNTGSGVNLLNTEEVAVFRSLLQIISNPLQDIPLLSVLASRVFCFSADELALIRGTSKNSSFYEALCKSTLPKAEHFLKTLIKLRRDARLYGLSRLIHQIFVRTRIDSIYSALPNGIERKENLQMFCSMAENYETTVGRDLDAFLTHLITLEEKGIANTSEQNNTGSVTIMSIHKSKGLEFPVVFLCGLSRSFNQENAHEPVLCHKDLGLGLSCIDGNNRVRYPSLARRAISRKILADNISEEMRVLYVAMTRARDRLIMTYASKTLDADVDDILLRTNHTESTLMTSETISPGEWILQAALKRSEAGEFFNLTGNSTCAQVSKIPWRISVVSDINITASTSVQKEEARSLSTNIVKELSKGLNFSYSHTHAINAPSKLTATQLKGRLKDVEVAENTTQATVQSHAFRKPAFIESRLKATDYGNAFHTYVQYVNFDNCLDVAGVEVETKRLLQAGLLTQCQSDAIRPEDIVTLVHSPLGIRMRQAKNMLREFKFSILDDSAKYTPNTNGESVLLQGVVDCALIEPEGITIIDFKTDQVNEGNLAGKVEEYRHQVRTYANALSRIFELPILEIYLYFSRINQAIQVTL